MRPSPHIDSTLTALRYAAAIRHAPETLTPARKLAAPGQTINATAQPAPGKQAELAGELHLQTVPSASDYAQQWSATHTASLPVFGVALDGGGLPSFAGSAGVIKALRQSGHMSDNSTAVCV